jgi:hypothetical protein
VEAIENVDGLAALLADHRQIRLPHVRADKLDLSGQFLVDGCTEPRKSGAECMDWWGDIGPREALGGGMSAIAG